jgi:hypothetical protein
MFVLAPGVDPWIADTFVDNFPTAGASSPCAREVEVILEFAFPEGIIGGQDRKKSVRGRKI